MEIRAGDVLFYHADLDNQIDRCIVAAQAAAGLPSWASHVALAISPDYIVEAVAPLVRVSALRLRPPAAWATPDYADRLAAMDYAVASIGKPYALVGVAAFGMGLIVPSFADRLADVTRALDTLTLWCSEEVAQSLVAGGCTTPITPTPQRCAPGHLVRAYNIAEPT